MKLVRNNHYFIGTGTIYIKFLHGSCMHSMSKTLRDSVAVKLESDHLSAQDISALTMSDQGSWKDDCVS